jgi:hypothetical protein
VGLDRDTTPFAEPLQGAANTAPSEHQDELRLALCGLAACPDSIKVDREMTQLSAQWRLLWAIKRNAVLYANRFDIELTTCLQNQHFLRLWSHGAIIG